MPLQDSALVKHDDQYRVHAVPISLRLAQNPSARIASQSVGEDARILIGPVRIAQGDENVLSRRDIQPEEIQQIAPSDGCGRTTNQHECQKNADSDRFQVSGTRIDLIVVRELPRTARRYRTQAV